MEALIGPDTVNTLPHPTMLAFADHGAVQQSLVQGQAEARALRATLAEVGIALEAVTQRLEEEGVALFVASYDELIQGVEEKRKRVRSAS